MKAVIQRVLSSSVFIEEKEYASITKGLLILLGIGNNDTAADVDWLTKKIIQLRIFPDDEHLMNRDIFSLHKPEILLISQFTLQASTKKGNRPSFTKAAKPELAIPIYNSFIDALKASDVIVKTGIFGADMKVHLINDGPVTIVIDTKNKE